MGFIKIVLISHRMCLMFSSRMGRHFSMVSLSIIHSMVKKGEILKNKRENLKNKKEILTNNAISCE